MIEKTHGPLKQDYISKIRYLNTLPPPVLNPKLLNYHLLNKFLPKKEAEQLMSSLFRKENFLNLIDNLDEELGMNLNLINNTGYLDEQKEEVIFGQKNKTIALDPRDRTLIRDFGNTNQVRALSDVAFLRRTEYISEKDNNKKKNDLGTTNKEKEFQNIEDEFKAETLCNNINKSFDEAWNTLNNFKDIKHPQKKHLTAIDAWPLLPDASMMDNKFMLLKLSGFAPISRELDLLKKKKNDLLNEDTINKLLKTSIFKPINNENINCIALYQMRDLKKCVELHDRMFTTEKEEPVNLLDEIQPPEQYAFHHIKNYDLNSQRFFDENKEISIKFSIDKNDESQIKTAYYYPIVGKIDLKTHRTSTNSEINSCLQNNTYDIINLELTEPTINELKNTNKIRSLYDPKAYKTEDLENNEIDTTNIENCEIKDNEIDECEKKLKDEIVDSEMADHI